MRAEFRHVNVEHAQRNDDGEPRRSALGRFTNPAAGPGEAADRDDLVIFLHGHCLAFRAPLSGAARVPGGPAGRSALASAGIITERPLRQCRTYWRGVREPDVHMERRQPAGHRLTRPADLLKTRRHLIKAQARVIAAGRVDNLIPAPFAVVIEEKAGGTPNVPASASIRRFADSAPGRCAVSRWSCS